MNYNDFDLILFHLNHLKLFLWLNYVNLNGCGYIRLFIILLYLIFLILVSWIKIQKEVTRLIVMSEYDNNDVMMWRTRYWLSNNWTLSVSSSEDMQIRNRKIIITKKKGTKSTLSLINWNENMDKTKKIKNNITTKREATSASLFEIKLKTKI